MSLKNNVNKYFQTIKPFLVTVDCIKYATILFFFLFGYTYCMNFFLDPTKKYIFHRRIFNSPDFVVYKYIYEWTIKIGCASFIFYILTVFKNFFKFRIMASKKEQAEKILRDGSEFELPEYPYTADSFGIVLGELHARDGSRVPSKKFPDLNPRWLIIPEKGMYTGFFVTGGIGSGKTASVAIPILDQMIRHQREVPVIRNGKKSVEYFRWSGLVTDEKGDFCTLTYDLCKKHGREKDFIRLAPGGYWKWNAIYNPGIETSFVAFNLAKLLNRFNKGQKGSDPFWDNSAKEFMSDFLNLIDFAKGYYSITDYLDVLISTEKQDMLYRIAKERWGDNPNKLAAIDALNYKIVTRRKEMGQNLLGSVQACAKAGLNQFESKVIANTFSPSEDDYFTGPCCLWPLPVVESGLEADLESELKTGIKLPQESVFTSFDAILERGKIVGLDMPKSVFLDAAIFIQISLKSNDQAAISRRDTRLDGKLVTSPRFGKEIGYCPTFIVADECQESVDPEDQNFMAQCRSKRACCVWLTQSHTSIFAAMNGKEKDAEGFFMNTMTHIYLRQSDMKSMEIIEKEGGKTDVIKTSISRTEGASNTDLSHFAGEFVHEQTNLSEQKSTSLEEKPRFEVETQKSLPDFTAIVIASDGTKILPATIVYLRPLYVFNLKDQSGNLKYPTLSLRTSWFDWPESLRKSTTLENLPQTSTWEGWNIEGPVEVSNSDHLSGFLSKPLRAQTIEVIHQLEDAQLQEIQAQKLKKEADEIETAKKRKQEMVMAEAVVRKETEPDDGFDINTIDWDSFGPPLQTIEEEQNYYDRPPRVMDEILAQIEAKKNQKASGGDNNENGSNSDNLTDDDVLDGEVDLEDIEDVFQS